MATPEPPAKRVEITVSTRTIATVLGTIAFVWAFIAARQAVLWIFIALFLAIVLPTPVAWLEERAGMKRGNAAMIVVLGARRRPRACSPTCSSAPFVGAVRDLIEDLPNIVERIRGSEHLPADRRGGPISATKLQTRAESLAADLPSKLGDAFEFGGRIFGFGLGAVTIVVHDALPRDRPAEPVALAPQRPLPARLGRGCSMLEERITRTIGRYAIGAVAIAAIAGTVQGTAAWLIGVPFALALGIVAGLLGLIPQVGATLAAVVLSLVALTQGVPAGADDAGRVRRLPAGRELRAPADDPGPRGRDLRASS